MIKPKILVTGATGKTGGAVVHELVKNGWPVRAVVRSHDQRSQRLASLGVEVVVADMHDPEQLLQSMQGVQRAYFLSLFEPFMIQSAVAFGLAANEAKLEHVVQMSQWTSSRAHPALLTRQTWLNDRLFGVIPGFAHTILNPGMFADNFLRTMDFAALLGIYPVLSGDGRAAPVSNEDIARTAAALLMDGPAKHDGKSYRPTGPELLSGRDMAKVVGKAVGHRVLPIDMPIWLLSKVARQQGVSLYEIDSIRHYMQDMKRGAFEYEGGVTNVVEELTGSPAESFETTARRYAELPFAKQTLGNRLKAFINFNLVPFYRSTNFDRWEKERMFPVPPKPSLTMDDPSWLEDRKRQMTTDPHFSMDRPKRA